MSDPSRVRAALTTVIARPAARDESRVQRANARTTPIGVTAVPRSQDAPVLLANGMSIHNDVDSRSYAIRFIGKNVSNNLVETVMAEIRHLLEPIWPVGFACETYKYI